MKSLKINILIASLLVTSITLTVHAGRVTTEEALTVANNWITLIIHHKGDWSGSNSAYVEEIREFRHGQRILGYFCRVRPRGHIVVSLRKELAPVKAYSAKCDMNPDIDKGVTAVIKGGMERVIQAIEKQLGSLDSVRTEQLQSILEVNHRSSWDKLLVNCESFEAGLESGGITMNYEGGEPPLLSTSWKQSSPYNSDCPEGDKHCQSCSDTIIKPPFHFPTAVGCVALAGTKRTSRALAINESIASATNGVRSDTNDRAPPMAGPRMNDSPCAERSAPKKAPCRPSLISAVRPSKAGIETASATPPRTRMASSQRQLPASAQPNAVNPPASAEAARTGRLP